MSSHRRVVALSALLLVSLVASVGGFKAEEFKKCADANFCSRNRGKAGDVYALQPDSVALHGSVLTATVVNEEVEPNVPLKLTVTMYNGFMRLHLNEVAETERYEVPNVLMDLQPLKVPATMDKGSDALTLQAGQIKAVIKFWPVHVDIWQGGTLAMSLNTRQMLNFEHTREKKEGDPAGWWEEKFRSHTDSKPSGPEAISIDVTFNNFQHVYGIPERATSLSLKPTTGSGVTSEPYRLYNLDVFEYLHESPFGLYGSIPMMVAHRAGLTVGAFWLNAAEMFVDVMRAGGSTSTQWIAESGVLDLFLMLGPSPGNVLGQYASITGSTAMPQMFALGYHQCRWNYNDEQDVADVDAAGGVGCLKGTTHRQRLYWFRVQCVSVFITTFPLLTSIQQGQGAENLVFNRVGTGRQNNREWQIGFQNGHLPCFDTHVMPYDVLWLDIEHTVGKRYMTWDSQKFPTPARMQDDIASRGRKMVVIIDPHVKRDSGFEMHTEAQEKGYYVRDKDNSTFEGWCWPGSSSYLDMMNPAIREWWAEHFLLDNYPGSTKNLYVWNDMNEPSVFNGPEVTMQKDNIHWSPAGDVEHRDVHNTYGMMYHKATADGLKLRGDSLYGNDSDRPFVLSRAFFSGTQTIGPIWTGDNTADWDHLRVSVPMLLSLGLTGLTYSGADVGGFFGNPDAQLMTRWYQLGVFYPFFRGHAHLETKRREPWLFGEPWTTRIREALRLRYQLLPTTYTLFREANMTGAPVMRPLWYEFPDDTAEDTFDEDKEFMFGPGMLVRPVLEADATAVELYLPTRSTWFNFWDGSLVTPPTGWLGGSKQRFPVPVTMDRIPIYLRGGYITVRRDRARRSTAAMASDPLTLVVVLDADGHASGDVYLDDGRSYAFMRGQFTHKTLAYEDGVLSSTSPSTGGGDLVNVVSIERIIVLGLAGGPTGWRVSLTKPRSAPLDAHPGPILLEPGVPDNALVVRRPGIMAGIDWSIRFEHSSS